MVSGLGGEVAQAAGVLKRKGRGEALEPGAGAGGGGVVWIGASYDT